MKNISVMIKPASSLCNMRCAYCFYADISSHRQIPSYGIMTAETTDRIIENILCDLHAGDRLTIAFQGGEPTLAGLPFFRYFVEQTLGRAKGIEVSWAFQTNGLVLDEEWCGLFKEHGFLVGLSYDFDEHDTIRLDAAGKGTGKRVLQAKALLERFGVDYNILCVLTNGLARRPQKIWNTLRKLGIRYVQFIPCLAEMSSDTTSQYALTPERYASFYKALFPLWENAYRQGEYISVKLIDDLLNLIHNGAVNACGLTGFCTPQFIVEADGSVYPCDFYVLDKYRLGSLCETGLKALFESPKMQEFAKQRDSDPICGTCEYINLCHGGCKRVAGSYITKGYCGHREIIRCMKQGQ